MSAPFMTISQGRREGEFSGPDGAYDVILAEVSEPITETAKNGPNAGEEYTYRKWLFAIDGSDYDGQTIEARTSNATGPKSKAYGYLVALFGGKAPPSGTQLQKKDIIGRSAIATIGTDDNDFPKVMGLSAAPKRGPKPVPAPKPEVVDETDDSLPF